MADLQATSIVQQTLALSRSHTHATALAVLDLVMQDRHGMDLDFDAPGHPFGDWTDPASPFGEVLRRAFGAHCIPADASALWLSEDSRDAARQASLGRDWQLHVIDQFAQRYKLWCVDAAVVDAGVP